MSEHGPQLGLSEAEFDHTKLLIQQMKVAELKKISKSLNLPLKGLKNELLHRIIEYFDECKESNDNIRQIAVRTIVLKLVQGQPIPEFLQLYQALYSGAFTMQDVPNQYSPADSARLKPKPKPKLNNKLYNTILLFKPSPFYSQRRMVKGSPFYAKPCLSKDTRASVQINFTLSKEERDLLLSKPSMKLYLFCGICANDSSDVDVEFPTQVELNCNGNIIRSSYKGLKHMKGTASPANLTPYVKKDKPNTTTMIYVGTVEPFLLYLYIVESYSSEQVFEIAAKNPHMHRDSTIADIKKEYEESDNDDIVMATSTISLKCPLSISRMKNPAKGVFCQHLQCFDLQSFIYSQETIPDWRCPICQNKIKLQDLAINDFLLDALNNTHEDVESISLKKDGTWEPVVEIAHADSRSPSYPSKKVKTPVAENLKLSNSPKENLNNGPNSDEIIEIIDSDYEDEGPQMGNNEDVSNEHSRIQTANNEQSSNELPNREQPNIPMNDISPPHPPLPNDLVATTDSIAPSENQIQPTGSSETMPIDDSQSAVEATAPERKGPSSSEKDDLPLSYFSQFSHSSPSLNNLIHAPVNSSVPSAQETGNHLSTTNEPIGNQLTTTVSHTTQSKEGGENISNLPSIVRSNATVPNTGSNLPLQRHHEEGKNESASLTPKISSSNANPQQQDATIVQKSLAHSPNNRPSLKPLLPSQPYAPEGQSTKLGSQKGLTLASQLSVSDPTLPNSQLSAFSMPRPMLASQLTSKVNQVRGTEHPRNSVDYSSNVTGLDTQNIAQIQLQNQRLNNLVVEQGNLIYRENNRYLLAKYSLQAGETSTNLPPVDVMTQQREYEQNLRTAALQRVGIEIKELAAQLANNNDISIHQKINRKFEFFLQIQRELLERLRIDVHDLQLQALQQSTAALRQRSSEPNVLSIPFGKEDLVTLKSLQTSLIYSRKKEEELVRSLRTVQATTVAVSLKDRAQLANTKNLYGNELQNVRHDLSMIQASVNQIGLKYGISPEAMSRRFPWVAPNGPIVEPRLQQNSGNQLNSSQLQLIPNIQNGVRSFETIRREQERQRKESLRRRLSYQQAQTSFSRAKEQITDHGASASQSSSPVLTSLATIPLHSHNTVSATNQQQSNSPEQNPVAVRPPEPISDQSKKSTIPSERTDQLNLNVLVESSNKQDANHEDNASQAVDITVHSNSNVEKLERSKENQGIEVDSQINERPSIDTSVSVIESSRETDLKHLDQSADPDSTMQTTETTESANAPSKPNEQISTNGDSKEKNTDKVAEETVSENGSRNTTENPEVGKVVESTHTAKEAETSEPNIIHSSTSNEVSASPRYSQSAFDLAMNKDKRPSHLVKGILGIQIFGDVINDGTQSLDEAQSISPLNFKVTNMTLETPNSKKRTLSNSEKLWNKRLNNTLQVQDSKRPSEPRRNSLIKAKFDPTLVKESDIIELDE